MKNVNPVDFDANINHDMCMKVMLLMDVYVYIVCVLSIYSFNFIMRIADDIIGHVHDDVVVSAYEYVNGKRYEYRYLCMYGLENEN